MAAVLFPMRLLMHERLLFLHVFFRIQSLWRRIRDRGQFFYIMK